MTSTPSDTTLRPTDARKVRRKSASDRRAEILECAATTALTDGLEQLTLRRVAVELGVTDSLVSHYFPSVDALLAEAFASAAEIELREVFEEVDAQPTPVAGLAQFLLLMASPERDRTSLLWVDAWHAGRRRPALYAEVGRQMDAGLSMLAEFIERGREAGDFTSADPHASAVRIFAVIDGLTIQAIMRKETDHQTVRELVIAVAARELGTDPDLLRH